jgi:glycosyltransferase involved in cell wall biosynthesis
MSYRRACVPSFGAFRGRAATASDLTARELRSTITPIHSSFDQFRLGVVMATARKSKVSLCMIVRNEEANLAKCLTPVAKLFDEIVIVDTGSQDRTREVAAKFTANIHEFEWCDDFSAARNESLRHASGDCIFWLDADDRVSATNVAKLQTLLQSLDNRRRIFMMETVLPSPDACLEATLVAHPRLFPRHPDLWWRGRVHEQLRSGEIADGYETVASDVQIEHVGYVDAALCHRKQHRKLRLLRMEYAVNPDDSNVLFHLGLAYASIHNFGEARKHLLRLLDAQYDWLVTARIYIALAEMDLAEGKLQNALRSVTAGLVRRPENEHLRYLQAQIYCQFLNLDAAAAELQRIIACAPQQSHRGIELGNIRKKSAPRLLADVFRMQGRFSAAETVLQPLLAAYPDDTLSWYALGLVAIDSGNQHQLDRAIQSLKGCPQGDLHGRLLLSRWHVRRNELKAAGELIDGLVAEAPQMPIPRMLRAEWLSRCGASVALQLQAVRDVIRIQPQNGEAARWLQALEGLEQATHPHTAGDFCTSVILMPGISVG